MLLFFTESIACCFFRLCGNAIPDPFTVPGNSMTVEFHSDANTHGTGFHASYSTSK